ncbi:MAG: hypothetical protein E7319_06520 [Clostridiales bacterium]|nr:hypothetical protein [Clostridiales bacterium]
MFLADLHIHSRFSRATSRELDPQHLELWARRKGLGLIGTGDLTHAGWRQELRDMMEPVGNGLYRLREAMRLPCETRNSQMPLFAVSGEISTIYKKNGKTRKVHHVILLPGLEEADELSHRLEAIGNLHSDGRPILGLDSHDLLEIVLETCPEAIYIPAHIWTPHFSLFGAFSGFDTLEECYEDLTPYVHALETGLSSDPAMNRCLSMLDKYQLVSSSDAHSPAKLGREATILEGTPDYSALKRALETGDGLSGTIEFFPEEGKYHLDGHRLCNCCLEPEETIANGGKCPVCGRRVTVGVLHRVRQLADRQQPTTGKPYECLIPLAELLAECLGVTAASKKVERGYMELLTRIGPEMTILRNAPVEQIEEAGGSVVAEAIRRLREGKVYCQGGYDGEYGRIRVFAEGEAQLAGGQLSLLDALSMKRTAAKAPKRITQPIPKDPEPASSSGNRVVASASSQPNPQQEAAVHSTSRVTAVIAGPGTGKTRTLISRIAYLLTEKSVDPREITAVTFTHQAAQEMQARLEATLGKQAVQGLTVGTFHAIALGLLKHKPIAEREQQLSVMEQVLRERGENLTPAKAIAQVSLYKNGKNVHLSTGVIEDYNSRLHALGLRDLDDVLLEALTVDASDLTAFHYLLVDEYQDINSVQHRLVKHWSSHGGNLFVIGDPDQSIYGFRGADAACFDRLLSDEPDAAVITLEQNYRSTGAVLECALSVIVNNPGGQRRLTANSGVGAPVRVMTAPDGFSEGVWIADEIMSMVGGMDMISAHAGVHEGSNTRAFSEIAVLCRTHRQLEQIENCLRHVNIPCVICGREHFWENATVQSLLSFFRWMLSPGDAASLSSALRGLWKCPPALINRAAAISATMESPDMAILRHELAPFDVLTPWLDTVESLLPGLTRDKPRKQLEALAKHLDKNHGEVEQLLDAAVFHKRMDEFLYALQTGEEADIRRRSGAEHLSGAVSLMTLHGSKGLEFPVVFLAGVNAGDLPHLRENEPSDEEEERRLFFVGMTRAKEELVLTCGGETSPFLGELPCSVKRGAIPQRRRIPKMQQLSLF